MDREAAPRRYRIHEVLGSGGFSTVYRAEAVTDDAFVKEVAIKVLHAETAVPEQLARLRDEARVLALVKHRALITVDGLIAVDGRTLAGSACLPSAGWVAPGGDCNDAVDTAFPGAPEQCNGLDDDCDGQIDVGVVYITWYEDTDGDGAGDDTSTQLACLDPGPDWVLNGGDCAVSDPGVFPGAPEHCDTLDEDCDLVADEEPVDPESWFPDLDPDTFGDEAATAVVACLGPVDHVADATDCDDQASDVNPAEAEVPGNGVDDDCDPGTPDTGAHTGDSGLPTGHTGAVGLHTGSTTDTDTDPDEHSGTATDTDPPTAPLGASPVDPGCGCSSPTGLPSLWFAPGLLALLRRRRAPVRA